MYQPLPGLQDVTQQMMQSSMMVGHDMAQRGLALALLALSHKSGLIVRENVRAIASQGYRQPEHRRGYWRKRAVLAVPIVSSSKSC